MGHYSHPSFNQFSIPALSCNSADGRVTSWTRYGDNNGLDLYCAFKMNSLFIHAGDGMCSHSFLEED